MVSNKAESARKWRLSHPEYGKNWRLKNHEKVVKYSEKYYAKNRQKVIDRAKQWRLSHPDAYKQHMKKGRKKWYAKKGLRYHREKVYREKYGITPGDYDSMLRRQSGVCAICGTTRPGGPNSGPRRPLGTTQRHFYVDHNHENGGVRGLLCCGCNLALGWYERNQTNVMSYLARPPGGYRLEAC